METKSARSIGRLKSYLTEAGTPHAKQLSILDGNVGSKRRSYPEEREHRARRGYRPEGQGGSVMCAAKILKPVAEASPSFKARMASVLFFLVMLTATLTELLGQGRLSFAGGIAADIIEVLSMVAVTLLLYAVFKPVNRELSLFAASVNLVGLTLEVFQWQPLGLGIGMVLHGVYWLLIGYLIFRSKFLPRILGVPMTAASLGWLTSLSPPLVDHLSPYNLTFALLAEGLVMLWLLVMGVNVPRWKEQANAAVDRRFALHRA
jgi:Domain of unknown function (DUF4386)